MTAEILSNGPDDTLAVARALGEILAPGDVVALTGELGAGKTLFCQGIGEALGIPPGRIVSPSFTIVAEHRGRLPLRHVDAYRLSSVREAEEIGLDELFGGDWVSVVEWADRIGMLLPNAAIRVKFLIPEEDGDRRRLLISAGDAPRFHEFLSRIRPFTTGG